MSSRTSALAVSLVILAAALGASRGAHAQYANFTNPAAIVCADRVSNTAGTNPGLPPLYPSPIVVSGLFGTIIDLRVAFAITTTFPDDLDILLIAPGGEKTLLISDAGGSGNRTAILFEFDQAAASDFPDAGTDALPVPEGTYRPANYLGFATPEPGGQDNFPSAGGLQAFPAPTLDVFDGTDPNGTWELYVVDDQVIDLNSLPSGWSLEILTDTIFIDGFESGDVCEWSFGVGAPTC